MPHTLWAQKGNSADRLVPPHSHRLISTSYHKVIQVLLDRYNALSSDSFKSSRPRTRIHLQRISFGVIVFFPPRNLHREMVLISLVPLLIFIVVLFVRNLRAENKARRTRLLRGLGLSELHVKIIGFFHPYWCVCYLILVPSLIWYRPVMQVGVERGCCGLLSLHCKGRNQIL